jgi:dipeptidyl aminopeptidase/acylaminoacyl peptidase
MRFRIYFVFSFLLLMGMSSLGSALAQSASKEETPEMKFLRQQYESLNHRLDVLQKAIDDVQWYNQIGAIAHFAKVRIYGPPRHREPNPTAQGAGNPVKFYAYIFIPKSFKAEKKYPLLVYNHGGVHSNFSTAGAHIICELLAQGYVIVAPEYRGSTGYGKEMYESIDYGGLEVEDAFASRNYMLENYDLIDKDRIGIVGWSHGGLITLMNIFNHPESYKVAFAGVPVSDLVARMGYKTEAYRNLYSADYHIGKSAYDDVNEYLRRSPAWNAEKLRTPLLIHTNTNDEDVNVLEVEHLIRALKAAQKPFEYEIFKDAPGGHAFDRLDTLYAKEIRLKIYRFLARHLNPPNPFNSVRDLYRVGQQPYFQD